MPGVPLYIFTTKKSQGMKNKEKKIHLFDQEEINTVRLELCLDKSRGTPTPLHMVYDLTSEIKQCGSDSELCFFYNAGP